ncbi:MAG: helix-turn-helix domain-containing protein [Candidatus Nezhaarchaeales archaeon]
MEAGEEGLSQIYQALSNPHRRRIIQLLGSRGPLPFSELKRSLRISVGALYHNLDQLKPLVFQLSDKRYALTERGMAAYDLLKRGADFLEDSASSPPMPPWARALLGLVSRLFLPKEPLASLYARPGPGLGAAAASALALGALACALTRTEVILTYVRHSRGSLSIPWLGPLCADPALLSALTFIATWLTFSILPYAIVSLLKWSWGWARLAKFMAGSALATLPAAAYVLIYNAVVRLGAGGYATYAALGAAFAILWAMMIGHIAAHLSVAKRVSSARALAVMVAVAYLCMASQHGLLVKWLLGR